MDRKQYSSVSEMLADVLPNDREFKDNFEQQISRRIIVRHLAFLRNLKRMSQADVASVLGCSRSKISKLENGYDADVSAADIKAYAKACNCDVDIVFNERGITTV